MNSLKLIIIINSLIIFKIIIFLKIIRESTKITSNGHKETGYINRNCLTFRLAFCCIIGKVNNLSLSFWYKHHNQVLLVIDTHSLKMTEEEMITVQ